MENPSLIQWKTQAWQNPQMVSWYATRMTDSSGTNPLKNIVERNVIDRYVQGNKIIDVGIGTGRGSLPLARRGLQVVGIDSSQAMLDETQRQAGTTPIELLQGDVEKLPCPDKCADTVLSLNVMVHFPHWQNVLSEWKRVLKPEGRIIFDIHSLDHLEAALPPEQADIYANAGTDNGSHGVYMSHARVKDIAAWADANQCTLKAIVPYASIYGKPAYNHWLAPLEDRFDWQRLLSWLGNDKKLLDLAVFIEETIISQLGSKSTCRFFAIIDNTTGDNQAWLRENEARDQAIKSGNWASTLPIQNPTWLNMLSQLLSSPRPRQFLFRLIEAISHRFVQFDFLHLAPEPYQSLFEDWRLQNLLDDSALQIAQQWPNTSSAGSGTGLFFKGVPLSPGLEYNLMENILTRQYGVFSGVRK